MNSDDLRKLHEAANLGAGTCRPISCALTNRGRRDCPALCVEKQASRYQAEARSALRQATYDLYADGSLLHRDDVADLVAQRDWLAQQLHLKGIESGYALDREGRYTATDWIRAATVAPALAAITTGGTATPSGETAGGVSTDEEACYFVAGEKPLFCDLATNGCPLDDPTPATSGGEEEGGKE